MGDTIDITVYAKNRDGTALINAASQTMTMTISATFNGAPVLEFNASPQITLQDTPTAEFLIRLQGSDYVTLTEDVRYFYNIWTDDGATLQLLQNYGEFMVRSSIEPS